MKFELCTFGTRGVFGGRRRVTGGGPVIPPIVNTKVTFIKQYEQVGLVNKRVFPACLLGEPDPNRDVFIVCTTGNTGGATVTGLSVNGVAVGNPIVSQSSSNSALGNMAIWKLRLPEGITADLEVSYSVANASGQVAILSGTNVIVSGINSAGFAATASSTISLTGAAPGHQLFVFSCSMNGATTWSTGLTRLLEEQSGSTNNSWFTIAEGVTNSSGNGSGTLTKVNGTNSQFAMVALAVGHPA